MDAILEKQLYKEIDGFQIHIEGLEEHITIESMFSEQIDIDAIHKKLDSCELVLFCARFTATLNGIEFATDYLGGCIYKDLNAFISDQVYIEDISHRVAKEAKNKLKQACRLLT